MAVVYSWTSIVRLMHAKKWNLREILRESDSKLYCPFESPVYKHVVPPW